MDDRVKGLRERWNVGMEGDDGKVEGENGRRRWRNRVKELRERWRNREYGWMDGED